MLLAKTLTSSTFKLALIAIGTFGVIVSAIFSYVYLSTSTFVRSRSDRAITAEYIDLQDVYGRSGRDALISLIRQRTSDTAFAGHAYVLSDRSSAVLAGNLGEWPVTATRALGVDGISRLRRVAGRDRRAAGAGDDRHIRKRRSAAGWTGHQ